MTLRGCGEQVDCFLESPGGVIGSGHKTLPWRLIMIYDRFDDKIFLLSFAVKRWFGTLYTHNQLPAYTRVTLTKCFRFKEPLYIPIIALKLFT